MRPNNYEVRVLTETDPVLDIAAVFGKPWGSKLVSSIATNPQFQELLKATKNGKSMVLPFVNEARKKQFAYQMKNIGQIKKGWECDVSLYIAMATHC